MVMNIENVTVVPKANVYYDGKVVSHTVLFGDGSKKTLGVVHPGEYEFGTAAAEIMEVVAGTAEALLPGQTAWQAFPAGTTFNIPANSSFKFRCNEITEYVCSYIQG